MGLSGPIIIFLPGGNQQGTLQQASGVSFGCIWPKTVGSSSHLAGTKSGAAGGLPGATEGPSKGDGSPTLDRIQLKKLGAGVGAHLVDSGQDMTLQAFACFL